MVREVVLFGDPILRQKAGLVSQVTDETRTLIDDMLDTMYSQEGVGLAAPQVGVDARIIVVDPRAEDTPALALVNPRVVQASEVTERDEEGCLSLPGLKDIVERSVNVVVEALDPDGQAVRIEAEGLLARILQHEIDHIDGILFIDRVSPLKRRMLIKKWRKVRT